MFHAVLAPKHQVSLEASFRTILYAKWGFIVLFALTILVSGMSYLMQSDRHESIAEFTIILVIAPLFWGLFCSMFVIIGNASICNYLLSCFRRKLIINGEQMVIACRMWIRTLNPVYRTICWWHRIPLNEVLESVFANPSVLGQDHDKLVDK